VTSSAYGHSLHFAPGPSAGVGGDATSAELAKIGVDAAFRTRFAEQVRAETSALFVLITRPAIRDKVLGVLRGFQGEIMLTELTGDDREVWRRAVLRTKQTEQMK
jgi:uncharacterized membrane protein